MASALLFGAGAQAADTKVWAKFGATPAGIKTQFEQCQAQAATLKADILSAGQLVDNGSSSGRRTLLGTPIDQAFFNHPYRKAAARRCMVRNGYARLLLTAEEQVAFKKQGEDRWLAAFLAGDIGARVDAARARIDPFDETRTAAPFGALAFDPASVKVVTGALPEARHANIDTFAYDFDEDRRFKGVELATAKVSYRKTGRVAAPFSIKDQLTISVTEGAIVYQVTGATAEGPNQTYWCGPLTINTLVGPKPGGGCFWRDDEGPALHFADRSQPWSVGRFTALGSLWRGRTTGEPAVTPSEQDLIGPLDFRLEVLADSDSIGVQAILGKDGKSIVPWSLLVTVKDGEPVYIPMAYGRFKLVREKKILTAEFEKTPAAAN
ncbi:MAG: hypothetical protein AB1942_16610 [Pseudomonadota bacterium]